jgi:hypothetical protein
LRSDRRASPGAAEALARVAAAALAWVVLASAPARAQDRFEIQVYDSEVADAGEPGVEVHTNYSFQGRRTVSPDGELPTEHVLNLTFEPHLGLFGWAEVGAYLQTAVRPEGSFDYAGVKLRFKAKWPDKFFGGTVGLAVNGELSRLPARYELGKWGSELRPIVDARVGPVYASVNPIVSIDLGGPLAGHLQLHPAAKLAFFATPAVSLGTEYYGGYGPVDAPAPAAEQSHKLYAVIDLALDYLDLNFGLGHGLGAADPWTAKAIVGIHPPARRPPTAR